MQAEALTVAMALVPGVCSRNRHFARYVNDPELRRARARAAELRGVVRQLAAADRVELVRHDHGVCELKFHLTSVRYARHVTLSHLEAACVAYLAHRSGVHALPASDEDLAAVESALKRLLR